MHKIERIIAKFQYMSQEKVLDLISASKYDEIKKTDAHPEFRVFVIGHEGEAKGKLPGVGEITSQWFKEAIKELGSKIKTGLKAFYRHNDDNSQEGRTAIGEIVGKAEREENGRLESLVVCYMYPQYRDIEPDVASVEADIVYNVPEKRIEKIEEVSGIALGNSSMDIPGFPGATLQACYQMFAEESGETTPKGGRTEMKLSEIKEAISSGGYVPSQLYEKEALSGDNLVIKLINEGKKAEYEHRKRTDEKFDEERENWEKEQKEYEEKINKLKVDNVKSNLGDKIDDLAKKRNLTDKQLKFVENNLDKFSPESAEDKEIDRELDRFVDNNLEEFNKLKDVFGIKDEDSKKKKDDDMAPADKETEDKDDMTSPENNDLIPQEAK